jgi:hypothetical protein
MVPDVRDAFKSMVRGGTHIDDSSSLIGTGQEHGQWDTRCDVSGDGVRVRPENLRAATNDNTRTVAILDPYIGDAFKSMVRGGTHLYDSSSLNGTG